MIEPVVCHFNKNLFFIQAYRMHCTGMLHTQKIAARDANQSVSSP